MEKIKQIMPIVQILVSISLIVLILIQQKGGGLFDKNTGAYRTLRGAEKKIFWITAFAILVFIALGLINLLF